MSSPLSAEEKNAKMTSERATLQKLLETALDGDFPKLQQLVKNYVAREQKDDSDVTIDQVLTQFKDGNRRTMLHFACQSDNPDIISKEQFLGCASNTNDWASAETLQTLLRLKDKDGLTPIMLAARYHKDSLLAEKRVLALLDAAATMETTTTTTTTATSKKKLNKLSLARSHAGATALHYASGSGATPTTIRALYQNGPVAIQTFSHKGGTPLHWACAMSPPNDYYHTIEALVVDCGADINASSGGGGGSSSGNGNTAMTPPPLHMSVAASNDTHAKCLIEIAKKQKLDLSSTLEFLLPGNVTIFHMLTDMNLVGTLALLLEFCNSNDSDNSSSSSSLQTLLNTQNHEGFTPLELAAKEGHVGCVLLLLPNEAKTEQDAKAYIEKMKLKIINNNNGTEKEQPPSQKKNDDPKSEESSSSPLSNDPIETKARQDADTILGQQKPANDIINKAMELKQQGNQHFARKEYPQAIDYYTQAIKLNPTDATFYSNRSACYVMVSADANDDDYKQKALYDAVMTRAFRPNWSKACFRMAVARFELGRYEDAAVSAWEGVQQDQDNEELKRLLQKCVKKGREEYTQKQNPEKEEEEEEDA